MGLLAGSYWPVDTINTNAENGDYAMQNETLTTERSTEHIWDLIRTANQGSDQALSALRKELSGPNANLLISTCGDLAYQAQEALLQGMVGESPGFKAIFREALQQQREDLGWHQCSKLERMLIDRVVLTWLYLHLAEMANAQLANQSNAQSKYQELRIDRASKRHLAAIKSLANVRKLATAERVDIQTTVSVKGRYSSPVNLLAESTIG